MTFLSSNLKLFLPQSSVKKNENKSAYSIKIPFSGVEDNVFKTTLLLSH